MKERCLGTNLMHCDEEHVKLSLYGGGITWQREQKESDQAGEKLSALVVRNRDRGFQHSHGVATLVVIMCSGGG